MKKDIFRKIVILTAFIFATQFGLIAQDVVKTVEADCFVKRGGTKPESQSPNLAYKHSAADGTNRLIYLRFDLSGIDVTNIETAKISMYLNSGFTNIPIINLKLYPVSDNTWDEKTVVFPGPAHGNTPFADLDVDGTIGWKQSSDLKDYLISSYNNGQVMSLAVFSSNEVYYPQNTLYFDSKEKNEGNAAKLVIKSMPVPTNISLNYDIVNLIPGKQVQLEGIFTPSDATKSATYSSTTNAVAEVNPLSGLVQAKSVGSTYIKLVSNVAPSVKDSTYFNVIPADTSCSMVYANFENGLVNFDGVWGNWPEGINPTTEIADNPVKDAANGSDKVLKVDSCFQFAAIVFNSIDMNKYDTVTFKVMSTTDIADFQFEIGLNGDENAKLNLPTTAGITANAWTEIKYPVHLLQTANRQFYIKLRSNGSKPGITTEGYTFYIDDVTFVAGGKEKFIPVSAIAINENAITTDNGTINLTAGFTPSIVSNDSVIWSLVNASADISDTVLFTANPPSLTAVRNGSVKVKATTLDGNYTAEQLITIINQVVAVDSFKLVPSADFPAKITTNGGKLRLDTIAYFYPSDASNQTINWSIVTDSLNKISESGEIEAFLDGNIWVKAVSDNNTSAYDSILISVSNQQKVTEIIVDVEGGSSAINTNGGTLQMLATVNPANSRVKYVIWSVNDPALATIDENGVLQVLSDGDVTVTATAIDNSGVTGSKIISLSPPTQLASIEIVGIHNITNDNENVTFYASVFPFSAIERSVKWYIMDSDLSNKASIAVLNDSTVVLTPIRNGEIKLIAQAVSNPSIADTIDIHISGQLVPATGLTVMGINGSTTIDKNNGNLQMTYVVTPADADIASVTWILVNSSASPDTCTLSVEGLLTAFRNGKAEVKVILTDENGNILEAVKTITINNQIIEVTGVTVTGKDGIKIIETLGGTLQMEATVTPADAYNKNVTWSINNVSAASISETGLLTAKSNGVVTVTATSNADNSKTGTTDITVSGQVSVETLAEGRIEIYPNPANNTIYIKQFETVNSIAIFNIAGKMEVNTNLNQNNIDISSLSKGIYLVKVTTKNNREELFKLVVE